MTSEQSPNSTLAAPPADIREYHGVLVGKGMVLRIPRRGDMVIGRDSGSALVLPDRRVSRKHAIMSFHDGHDYIRDMSSRNGTFVNKQRIEEETALEVADEIEIYPFSFIYMLYQTEAPADSDPNPTSAVPPASPDEFSGNIEVAPLADLIQLLNATRRTGALKVHAHGLPSAALHFEDGEIVYVTRGDLQNEEAFFEVFGTTKGRFEFTPGKVVLPDKRIRMPTMTMLLEASARMDEHR